MTKKTNKLIMPDLTTSRVHELMGLILSVFTLGLFFVLWYGALYERKGYWNRKTLYDYLKNNELPVPIFSGEFTHWIIDDIKITTDGKTWYVLGRNSSEVKICSFIGGLSDRYRYKRIAKMLGL